jgi:predicted nucleic acid-binding protein
MILVDTSIWVDFLDRGVPLLHALLQRGEVLAHPFVIGEFAMGSPGNRKNILADLADLPQAVVAQHDEVIQFIETSRLFGLGIGFIDAHLLASVRITPNALLWTRDRRLHEAAEKLSLAFVPS